MSRPRSLTTPISPISPPISPTYRQNSDEKSARTIRALSSGELPDNFKIEDIHTTFDFASDTSINGGQMHKLVSPEDEKLSNELSDFVKRADVLLARVESRRTGYNSYKKLKKQASAIKHSIKGAISDGLSLLRSGRAVDKKRTKLDELVELVDDLTQKYEGMSKVFMERTLTALDLQNSLIEQTAIYKTRMTACIKHNKALSHDAHKKWTNAFEFVCQLDDTIKSYTKSLEFQESVTNERKRNIGSAGAYIPWALRMAMTAEDETIQAEKDAKIKAAADALLDDDNKIKQQYIDDINVLKNARDIATEFMNEVMEKRECLEGTLDRLNDTQKYLLAVKEKVIQISEDNAANETVSSGNDLVSDSNDTNLVSSSPIRHESVNLLFSRHHKKENEKVENASPYDHSECADCDVVHSIARNCGDQLVAAYFKASENAEQLNELLIRGESLRAAQQEIKENFTAWGDLPQSYSGGIYSPGSPTP